MSDAPFSCNQCGRGWTGLKECHCATCHESFSTESNFDRHRIFDVDGDWETRRCLTPEEMVALRTKSGSAVLDQSQRKFGRVWVSSGGFPTAVHKSLDLQSEFSEVPS